MIARVSRLINQRKEREEKEELGICLAQGCNEKAVNNTVLCEKHGKYQKEYRDKKRKRLKLNRRTEELIDRAKHPEDYEWLSEKEFFKGLDKKE